MEPLNDSCCDHLHGCGGDQRHYHKCCGHWHGIEPLFYCEACGGTFPKAWSDDEAKAEADAAGFVDQSVVVCDECYRAMMALAEREGWMPDAE